MQISTLGAYEIGILDAIYSDVENNKIMKQNAAVGKNAITTTTTSSNELAHVALNMEQLTLSKAPEKVTISFIKLSQIHYFLLRSSLVPF